MNKSPAVVRFFEEKDIPRLYLLMKELAAFEGYLDGFKITEQYLKDKGLGSNPLFQVLVAEVEGEILGYEAFYYVPFTYRAKPKMVLKELYLSPESRGFGLGTLLFDALKKQAKLHDAGSIEWLVLLDNEPAKSFYRKQGAERDDEWETWLFEA
ncbi:MAG: GNAT family N-acetyltransferase [Motiliproteus sp.]